MPKNISAWWVIGALALVTVIVFGQVGRHDFVTYDDDVYITHNPHVKKGMTIEGFKWAFTTTTALHWHPLTWLSHMLDWRLFGSDPKGHHLHNLLLHTINSVLLFLFLKRWTGAVWGSAMVAALFAVHPLHVEPVAWLSSRKDLLTTFFWLLAMTAYGAYAKAPRPGMYLLAFMACVLGLMSKTITVALPLVLLLLDFWPLQRINFFYVPREMKTGMSRLDAPALRQTSIGRLVIEKIPFLAAAVLVGIVTMTSIRAGRAIDLARAYPTGYDLGEAMVNSLQYVMKTVWPVGLTIHYPYLHRLAQWQIWAAAVVLAMVTWVAVRQARPRPYLIFGWLWYLLTLTPVLGIVNFGPQRMADRYTYIPLIGLFIIIAWGLPDILRRWRHGSMFLKLAAAAVLLTLALCAWQQCRYWKNSVALYERAIAVDPGNYLAFNNLGNALAQEGSIDAAMVQYEKALTIKPDYDKVYNNIGILMAKKGDFGLAIFHFQKALSINSGNAKAHNNLGFALEQTGALAQAIDHYKKALQINPQYERAHENLSVAEARRAQHLE